MPRKVDEELNLSPFIGLFAMLVVMLLLTAVWNQLSSLQTNTQNSTSSDTPPPNNEKQISLAVTILQDRVQITEDAKGTDVANVLDEPNIEELGRKLASLKLKYPKKKDITLNTDNKVPYRHLIVVFDTLVGTGWPDVGVNTQ